MFTRNFSSSYSSLLFLMPALLVKISFQLLVFVSSVHAKHFNLIANLKKKLKNCIPPAPPPKKRKLNKTACRMI